MRTVLLLLGVLVLSACSTTKKIERTKFSDKNMRVMVFHENLPSDEYVRLNSAVIRSNRFVVIDRARGFEAIKAEQDMIHKQMPDRFDNKQKFAHYGKLYGVGAVLVGHIQCSRAFHRWSGGAYQKCYQAINMIDSNTGEIVAGVESEQFDLDYSDTSDWMDTVDTLVAKYPKYFEEDKRHPKLIEYEEVSKEEATRVIERTVSSSNE